MNLAGPLYQHVKNNNLGVVYAAETGFKLESNPDTVRAPDVAFVRIESVQQTGRLPGYRSGSPDLAVEVLSPSDRVSRVEESRRAHGLGSQPKAAYSDGLSLAHGHRDTDWERHA